MKRIINKYDNIFIILLIMFCSLGIILNVQTTVTDELWNFNSIYKMYNGRILYKDINVITTPLFFYIGLGIFKVLEANILTFKIYNILISVTWFLGLYILLKNLKIKKINSLFYTLLMMFLYRITLSVGANYNILVLVFSIYGIILRIKKEKYKKAYPILQGTMIFLVFLTKQNVGLLYMTGVIISELITQKNKSKAIIDLIKQFAISAALLVLFIVVLILNKSLNGFINYTILGIKEFSKENFIIESGTIAFKTFTFIVIVILIWIFSIILIKKKFVKEDSQINIKILLSYSIPFLLISYPIFNQYHIFLAMFITVVLFIYCIDESIIKEVLPKKICKNMIVLIIVYLMIEMMVNVYKYNINYIKDKNSPYYGAKISEENQDKIEEVTNFIKQNKENNIDIIIISEQAALYNIPLNESNSIFDLPFYGNMGKDGENGLINKIKELKNTKILIIEDEEKLHPQESKIIRDYIKENMKNTGTISDFLIYEKEI